MTKEELEKEAEEYFKSICGDYNEEYERTGKRHYWVGFDIKNAYLASAEPREKRIEELEEKISVLLSCKNCPENKGGLLCVKEYENKCLAQKIQYIKELKEENENLKKTYRKQRNKRIDDLQKENAELKEQLNCSNCSELSEEECESCAEFSHFKCRSKEQLTKAKEIIKTYYEDNFDEAEFYSLRKKAEQCLSEV